MKHRSFHINVCSYCRTKLSYVTYKSNNTMNVCYRNKSLETSYIKHYLTMTE